MATYRYVVDHGDIFRMTEAKFSRYLLAGTKGFPDAAEFGTLIGSAVTVNNFAVDDFHEAFNELPRKQQIERERFELSVDCPTCGATAGSSCCRTGKRWETAPHRGNGSGWALDKPYRKVPHESRVRAALRRRCSAGEDRLRAAVSRQGSTETMKAVEYIEQRTRFSKNFMSNEQQITMSNEQQITMSNEQHLATRQGHVLHILKRGYLVTLSQLYVLYRNAYSKDHPLEFAQSELHKWVGAMVTRGEIHKSTDSNGASRYAWRGAVIITDEITTRVVDVMEPGRAMSTREVGERYECETGMQLTVDAFNGVLSHLHHQRDASGARLMQYNADESWTRLILVGMGATICGASDRRAATVIAVSRSGHKITVREDRAIRTDGNRVSEDQSYSYEPDENGAVREFYRNANGRYGNRRAGGRLTLGLRAAYHDYSF